MKFRIFSLATLVLFASISTVSALRIQSQVINQLNVSQLSYSEKAPFEVHGEIWGTAPKGEVTRILYRIEDVSGTTTWEFSEPFARTYEGTEALELKFKFDFSDALVDENCMLFVELQKSTMNGAFAQTLAQGKMPLVFPPKATEAKAVSRIEIVKAFFDKETVVTQTRFRNLQNTENFIAQVKIFGPTGKLIQKKSSVVMAVSEGEEKEISVLLDAPERSGRYTVQVQVFANKKAVTGIKKVSLIKKGDFALISELEISPNQYFYIGDQATITFSGMSSSWGEPLIVGLLVKDASGGEVFAKEFPVQTNEIGRFSGEAKFTIKSETHQLHVLTKLRRGAKILGVYEFVTRPLKKLHATEGQSEVSFAVEQASQDFSFSGPRVKMGIIVGVGILILLILGFIFLVRHMRHLKLFILLLVFCVAGVDAAVTSEYPVDGWIVNPQASGADFENFKKLKFKGEVDLGTGDMFIINTQIDVDVEFGTTTTVSSSFQTTDPNTYEFVIDVPVGLAEGTYPIVLVMTGAGVVVAGTPPNNTPPLEIDLNLSIVADTTAPTLTFDYVGANGILTAGEFTNVPVELGVVCTDTTGCLPGSADQFEVKGNFCSAGAFCETGKTDDFVLCDQVGNCTGSTQVEINHYDPVVPELTNFDITKDGFSAKTKLKALESYVFSLVGLNDPIAGTVLIDGSACDSLNSPFFDSGSVCKEKLVSCAISAEERGTLDQENPSTCQAVCPPNTVPSGWGTCIDINDAPCSYTHFPFCFTWELGGGGVCNGIFPFCFNMIMQ